MKKENNWFEDKELVIGFLADDPIFLVTHDSNSGTFKWTYTTTTHVAEKESTCFYDIVEDFLEKESHP